MSSPEPTISELFDLRGQVALVTGAGGYLGRAMATALAEAGARVIATSRVAARAQQAVAQLPVPFGQTHIAVALDYLDDQSIAAGFQQAVDATGGIDILVNNGHAAIAADWHDVSMAQFNEQLANASGYFELARHLRNHAVARGAGAAIIMLGSMYGLVGSYPEAYADICPGSPVAYHTLKGGIIQMTRHLGVYWAADSVRVNCLCPGPFPDPDRAPRQLIDRLQTHVPLKRMGEPFELKGAAVFLASRASSYMTGQVLVIDGGWTAW